MRARKVGLLALASGMSGLAGCAVEDVAPSEKGDSPTENARIAEEPSRSREVRAFDCAGKRFVVSEFQPDKDRLVLFLPGRTVFLPQVISASGAKFSDGEVTFWSKGDDARLDLPGNSGIECATNHRATTIESVKLDGADFWAWGNEPQWTLTVYPERMILHLGDGQERHGVRIKELNEDRGKRSTRILGVNDADGMIVTLRGEGCTDSVSRESFQTEVIVDWNGQRLTGCGQALH